MPISHAARRTTEFEPTSGGRDTPTHGGDAMKALIKGGLFLALGWLANHAAAQDIQWRASATNINTPVPVAPAPASGIRAVSVGQPTRLDDADTSESRPFG